MASYRLTQLKALLNSCGQVRVAARCAALAYLYVCGFSPNASAGTPCDGDSLAPLLRDVVPAVVNIAVKGRVKEDNPLYKDLFFRQFLKVPKQLDREFQAAGSGVIVDADRRYVLTNSHVVENASKIKISTKDGRTLGATIIGSDSSTDIALIKIQGAAMLKALPFGDSDKLEVGDTVVAIGNPFGLGQTVTSGIVSALGRSGLGIEEFEDFIQTDASINSGNSGGALVNLCGQLIGINTAILAPSGGSVGIGFAIPINFARAVMSEFVEGGQLQRGWTGLTLQELSADITSEMHVSTSEGALVAEVHPQSPAERAGMRKGDVIVAIGGTAVRSAAQLRNKLGIIRINQRVDLVVVRSGRTAEVKLEIAPPPDQMLRKK